MTAHTATPELTIVDGHYPSFKEIAGLPFEVSVVMFAAGLSDADEAARTEAMERICKTWNAHDDLVKALECAQRLLDKDITYGGATAVLPFESLYHAINHVREARQAIAAALTKAGA